MKKMNKWLQRCKAAGKTFLAAFAVFLMNTQTAYASGISESKLAKGTEKLIGDATTWLMVLAPVVAGRMRKKLADVLTRKEGEGFVDTALKILISVVVGALLLAGLYALFKDTILPTLTQRIQNLFNYQG